MSVGLHKRDKQQGWNNKPRQTKCFFCFRRTLFVILWFLLYYFQGDEFWIRSTDFGSEPYLSKSPTKNNPHLLGPDQEKDVLDEAKTTANFFISLRQFIVWPPFRFIQPCPASAKEHEKIDDGHAYGIIVQTTEDNIEQLF